MLTSEVLGQVKRRFADESGIIIIDQDIFDWMNEASNEIVRVTESNKTSITITGTQYGVASNRLLTPNALLLKYVTYNNIPVGFTTIEDLKAQYGDISSQINTTPHSYYLDTWGQDDDDPNATVDTAVKLFPSPPSDATVIAVSYLKRPTKIVASANPIDIPVAFHGALMNFCLARANERVQNWQAFGEYMDAFTQAISQNRYESLQQDDSYPVIRDDPSMEPYWW
jgi:uncharacterized protein DUF6682